MTFQEALSEQLGKHPKRFKRLREFFARPESEHKSRIMARLEAHARVHLGLSPTEAIDWSSIDWASLFEGLMKLLMLILPLFL